MTRNRLIRTLCVSLVLVILILSGLLTLALKLGIFAGTPDVEDKGHAEYTGPVETDSYTKDFTGTLPPFTYDPPPITTDPPGPTIDPDALAGFLGGLLASASGALADQTALFDISGDAFDDVYLKMSSYGDYDGQKWSSAPEYDKLLYEKYSADYLRGFTTEFAGTNRLTVAQKLRRDPASGAQPKLYYSVAPYYIRYSNDESISVLQSDTTVEVPEDALKLIYGNSSNYCRYEFLYSPESGVQNVRSDSVAAYELEYRQFVYENYLELDPDSVAYMNMFSSKNQLDPADPDIIEKAAEAIKSSADYDLNYDKELDLEENVAISFLSSYRRGVCSHFASAAVLLYRSLGIPARYTVGFLSSVRGTEISVTVRAADAHAWVEVYEDGIGWRRVEITGSSALCPGPGADHNKDNCSYTKVYTEAPTPNHDGYTIYVCNACGSGFIADYKVYTEETTPGPIELPSRLILRPKTAEKIYDGKPLYATEITGFPQELTELGYTYKCEFSGERTEVGKGYSRISSIRIFSPEGVDVTSQFSIYNNVGTLQVYRDYIVFASSDAIATYPNIAHTPSIIKLVRAPEGFDRSKYMVDFSYGSSSTVGSSPATFTVTSLFDPESNTNALNEYKIVYEYGTLTVLPSKLVIRAGSATQSYNGSPLTNNSYSIVSGRAPDLNGHIISSIRIVGSQTAPGSSDNIIQSIVIVDQQKKDVTSNYQIEFLVGTLTVTY